VLIRHLRVSISGQSNEEGGSGKKIASGDGPAVRIALGKTGRKLGSGNSSDLSMAGKPGREKVRKVEEGAGARYLVIVVKTLLLGHRGRCRQNESNEC